MGQDLAKKAAPAFKKAWDRERRKLKEGDLLTLLPEEPRFVLQAALDGQVRIEDGDTVHIRGKNDALCVEHDLMPIGVILDASPEMTERLRTGEIMLTGEVHAVHLEAGIIEIVIR